MIERKICQVTIQLCMYINVYSMLFPGLQGCHYSTSVTTKVQFGTTKINASGVELLFYKF